MIFLATPQVAATIAPDTYVCPGCGQVDADLIETGRIDEPLITKCCEENPVAWTCTKCAHEMTYLPDGSEPENCLNCGY